MNRRQLIQAGLALGASALGAPMLNLGRARLLAAEEVTVSTRAVDVVAGATVIDMLGFLTLDWQRLYRWQDEPASFGDRELRGLEASGVDVFHPAVETSATDPHEGARRWLAGWSRLLATEGCFLARVASPAELLRATKRGQLGVIVGFQNANHFRTAADVELFRSLGQTVSQLTYNTANRLGSGCCADRDLGLTAFGRQVVAAMNRVGMAIDISHSGDRTSREAIAASRRPVLITHSNCRALVPHQRRCKPDDVIRLMAAGGGVMGITVVRGFVGSGSPSLADVLDHFDHVARLVGIEHVGLGSDVDLEGVDPISRRPLPYYQIRGLDLERRVFQIADGLLARGYSAAQVGLVLGGNFQRALADIWSVLPWTPLAPRELARDPFCPAPAPVEG